LDAATGLAAAAADPSLRTVMSRVEQYVEQYESQLSTLVAREDYVQRVPAVAGRAEQVRALVSDYLFFRSPGRYGPWFGFRDVLSVDGAAVARQGERLRDIVASPDRAESRAMALALENGRYHIGRFSRTINVPVCVVGWMHRDMRDRFRFDREAVEDRDGVRVWRVRFRERDRPLVRTPDGRPVKSEGRLWIDPGDGTILKTELLNALEDLRVTIQVEFRRDAELGLHVPVRMTERYDDGMDRLETEATYAEYRRFSATARIK
jgi:hypothetical protein